MPNRPLLVALAVLALPAAAQDAQRDSIVHLLNRAAWGPRPGDLDRVATIGVRAWIDAQLDPQRIEDRRTGRMLGRYRVLNQSSDELMRLWQEDQRANRQRQAMGDSGMMTPAARGPATGIRRANIELQQATMARAILSERQLYEVLVDVWTNHFNVFLGKAANRALTADYIASAIRPNALGRFEDLLLATARHPAMLIYLDNVQSVAEGAEPPRPAGRRGQQRAPAQRLPSGINENYARELLELHTVGVDGGYTQEDVVAVARILTGWSLEPRNRTRFQFHAWAHDRGAKIVMGRTFPAGRGEQEGLELLRWLANHPSTMRHVSAKLCARFVADEPPDGCVDAGVRAWTRSEGQIAEVVRAILLSPEFWAPEHRASKIKTPLEFVVSAARALGAEPDTSLALPAMLQRLGQPLFLYSPPTGYPERMESWVSSSALFDRFNLAVGLASGRLRGLVVDLGPFTTLDHIAAGVLPGGMTPATRDAIQRETADLPPAQARVLMVGLALGSPEFQRQ